MRYLEVESLREQIDDDFKTYGLFGEVMEEETVEEKRLWRALLITATYVGRKWCNVEERLVEAGWDVHVDAMVTVGSRTSFKIRSTRGEEEESEKSAQ